MLDNPAPTAESITVAQVLDLLDGRFAAVAAAFERRRFALWLGSGISRGRAPDVGDMLARAIEHLRRRVDPVHENCRFRAALGRVLDISGLVLERRAAVRLDLPFNEWPERNDVIGGLWDRYSDVLDIRIEGEPDDYMVWEAVDVRQTYGAIDDPDCEHLCIAILIMEGAIADIATANWDGLIEAAVRRLSGGARLLQVVVDPSHLRDLPAQTRLIKFHGCAIHCIDDPATYRRYLIATRPQITFWPHNPILAALRDDLRGVATTSRTLMLGLSLQDTNLQDLFAAARAVLTWPWPSAPDAQGHVFCQDALGVHQINMLRVVYGNTYNANGHEIEASALLRALAKQALLAIVLHLLSEKLASLVAIAFANGPLSASAGDFSTNLRRLRDRVAAPADPNYLEFVNEFVRRWSRGMCLFRFGYLPAPDSRRYEPISPLPIQDLGADPNIQTSGLPEFAVGLALLAQGDADGSPISLPGGE